MKLQKLYFDRHYDQWKGLPVSIEEEVNGYGLYIQSPDLKDIDRIKENGQFFAIFEKLDEVAYGEVYDVDKRILRLEMPPEILSKDGLYTVTFTTSYKKNEETIIKNSAIQSFSILDIIEVSDEYIENYDKYSLLNDLLKNVQDTEIDTTMFAKTEEVEKLIEDALNGVDLNTILKELEIDASLCSSIVNSYLNSPDLFTSFVGAYLSFAFGIDFSASVKAFKNIMRLCKNSLPNTLEGRLYFYVQTISDTLNEQGYITAFDGQRNTFTIPLSLILELKND